MVLVECILHVKKIKSYLSISSYSLIRTTDPVYIGIIVPVCHIRVIAGGNSQILILYKKESQAARVGFMLNTDS